jgi:cell division protein FtsB
MDQSQPPAPDTAPARRPRIRQRLRTPQEARQWRRRVGGYVLGGVVFVLVVNALVGENGYLASVRAQRERDNVTAELKATLLQNEELRDQIRRVKEDDATIEDAARRDLHLGKPGETMVIVKDHTKDGDTPAKPGK